MGDQEYWMKKMETLRETAEATGADRKEAEKPDESKALMGYSQSERSVGRLADRDALLAQVENEKKASLIRAWSNNERTKADNKAQKKISSILSWENSRKAALEAELKRAEEKFERKKAEFAEKVKNKAAMVHKEAEERRATVEAKHGERLLKTEEAAARYHSTGLTPKKGIGCFGS